MDVAFATSAHLDGDGGDDQRAADLLGAQFAVWNDPSVDWHRFDRVIVRSTWDYTTDRDNFLAWARHVGPERLRNSPELVEFNSDKHYLSQLRVPTLPTVFIAPGDPIPALGGEVVVKPTVSAGGRDTGRFDPAYHGAAAELIASITASGRTAMVQPYMHSVDTTGETALVYLGGRLSHVLNKGPVLRPNEVAPLIDDSPTASAAIMYDEALVCLGSATAAQQRIGRRTLREIEHAFGMPTYLRVDLVNGPAGSPVVMEVEAIEPCLYLGLHPRGSERLAAAVLVS